MPGGKLLAGNTYFKQKLEEKPASEAEDGEAAAESEVNGSEDEFKKMQQQVARYYLTDNPTIKCRNCKQFGHMQRDCPNERSRLNCILCGKDTHDSFECTEKLCFKCNQVGHKASECDQTKVDMCTQCGMAGHTQQRCLKVWHLHTDSSGNQSRFGPKVSPLMWCMECGNSGHFKCTSHKRSGKVKIQFRMKVGLIEEEFSGKPKETSSSEGESLRHMELGCAACGSKRHDVSECNDRRGANQRFFQYENLRNKFARDRY